MPLAWLGLVDALQAMASEGVSYLPVYEGGAAAAAAAAAADAEDESGDEDAAPFGAAAPPGGLSVERLLRSAGVPPQRAMSFCEFCDEMGVFRLFKAAGGGGGAPLLILRQQWLVDVFSAVITQRRLLEDRCGEGWKLVCKSRGLRLTHRTPTGEEGEAGTLAAGARTSAALQRFTREAVVTRGALACLWSRAGMGCGERNVELMIQVRRLLLLPPPPPLLLLLLLLLLLRVARLSMRPSLTARAPPRPAPPGHDRLRPHVRSARAGGAGSAGGRRE